MKKEDLLYKKQKIVAKMPWYFRCTLTCDDIRAFSCAQLERMVDVTTRAEDEREKHSPFFTLSATEVIQKESGKIAQFQEDGSVTEETPEEVERGASSSIYSEYRKTAKK